MTDKKFFTRFTAAALALFSLSAFAPAAEARDWDRGDHRREHRDWRHDRGHHYGRYQPVYYARPRPVVVYSQPYYYRPQPVYYQPRPASFLSYSVSW